MGGRRKASTVEGWVSRITRIHFGGLIVRDAPADAYRVRLGWYDKAKTDAVMSEAATLLVAETTTEEQRARIYWLRSFFLWDLQRFEDAASDVQKFLAISKDETTRKVGQRNLGAMRKRKLAHEMI